MHAADEADGDASLALALADAHGVTLTLFPGQVGQRDALEIARVVLFTEENRGLDFVRSEVTAAPDDIAVASPLQAVVDGVTAFHLPLAVGRIHFLESSDAVAVLFQPVDLFRGHVSVHGNAVSILAVADNNDAKLRAEGAQVAAITTGYGDVVEGHPLVEAPSERLVFELLSGDGGFVHQAAFRDGEHGHALVKLSDRLGVVLAAAGARAGTARSGARAR